MRRRVFMMKLIRELSNKGILFREKRNKVFRDEKIIKLWIMGEMK